MRLSVIMWAFSSQICTQILIFMSKSECPRFSKLILSAPAYFSTLMYQLGMSVRSLLKNANFVWKTPSVQELWSQLGLINIEIGGKYLKKIDHSRWLGWSHQSNSSQWSIGWSQWSPHPRQKSQWCHFTPSRKSWSRSRSQIEIGPTDKHSGTAWIILYFDEH